MSIDRKAKADALYARIRKIERERRAIERERCRQLRLQDEKPAPTEEQRLIWEEARRSIGHALRRAAGLPDADDPFAADSSRLRNLTALLISDSYGPSWPRPRAVETELEEIRNELRRLKDRLESLDRFTRITINRCGDPEGIDRDIANMSSYCEHWYSHDNPLADPDKWAVPSALAAMRKLEAAIVATIKLAIKAGEPLPKTGRIPNYAKNWIALEVARYLMKVTGKIPALTTRPKIAGPFARALSEIFEILALPSGVQRPGEYAIAALTSELSKNTDF